MTLLEQIEVLIAAEDTLGVLRLIAGQHRHEATKLISEAELTAWLLENEETFNFASAEQAEALAEALSGNSKFDLIGFVEGMERRVLKANGVLVENKKFDRSKVKLKVKKDKDKDKN